MLKPSLRELLGLVRDCDKFISPEMYVLLQALVEAVESDTLERAEIPHNTFQILPYGERIEVASPSTQQREA